eukprot:TRINITY_DN9075_c0_g1_i1.p1 TRINITY_DN9075_c0_g1~~TRINITY_DN9075_c0_g1_i1.p1  ORF type:complete len:279 (+),score=34.54 TRINITY_DN9075_c0_g1_i1:697-1533(+)
MDVEFEYENWFIKENTKDQSYSYYLSLLIWAISNFEYVGFEAGRVKNSSTTFPRAMIVSVFLMQIALVLPMLAALGITVNPLDYSEGGFLYIISKYFPWDWIRISFICGAVASNLGIFAANIENNSDWIIALSECGLAPKILGTSPGGLQVVLNILTFFCTMFNFEVLVKMSTLFYCVHLFLVYTTFLYLRYKQPNMNRPYKFPGGIGFQILFSLPTFALAGFNIVFTLLEDWVIGVSGLLLFVLVINLYFIRKYMTDILNYRTKKAKYKRLKESTDI